MPQAKPNQTSKPVVAPSQEEVNLVDDDQDKESSQMSQDLEMLVADDETSKPKPPPVSQKQLIQSQKSAKKEPIHSNQ